MLILRVHPKCVTQNFILTKKSCPTDLLLRVASAFHDFFLVLLDIIMGSKIRSNFNVYRENIITASSVVSTP